MRAQGAWAAAATAVAAFGLTGCSIFGSSSPSPSPTSTTPTMPAAACAEGDSVTPPDIADFTLDGVAAAQFATPLVVPYNGLKGSSDGQPSVLRLEVVTSTSGAPVRFRATGAQLLSSLTDDTLGEPEVTVFSEAGPERCVASAYLFSTVTGPAKVVVEGLNSAEAALTVITTREASRDVSLSLSAATVDAGETVDAIVAVTDVFGNPIENASVDLSLPAKGPGVSTALATSGSGVVGPAERSIQRASDLETSARAAPPQSPMRSMATKMRTASVFIDQLGNRARTESKRNLSVNSAVFRRHSGSATSHPDNQHVRHEISLQPS